MAEEAQVEVFDAKVVAMFPPRPDAVMTLLQSDAFLPGTQTLLYSLKKTLSLKQTYPPEIVVLVTPNVSPKIYQHLCPALCTRILPITDLPAPLKTIDSKLGKNEPLTRTLDNHSPSWTKLKIFSMQQYDTILYIDSDSLVLKDVSNLLKLNKVYTESEALIAAAPDMLPPHYFNSGVMVVRPSMSVFEAMERHASLLTTYDGTDTGFLNAYFNTWHTDFPPQARLPAGYNAQQAMFDLTVDDAGNSSFWDVHVGSDLFIVHYSNAVKPWELVSSESSSLQTLWKTWHQKSKNFLLRYEKEKAKEKRQREDKERKRRATKPAPSSTTSSRKSPPQIHTLVQKRFKELRAEDKSTQEAMQQARAELLPNEQEIDVGSQVAAMFGMR